jgi:hypothetical protein
MFERPVPLFEVIGRRLTESTPDRSLEIQSVPRSLIAAANSCPRLASFGRRVAGGLGVIHLLTSLMLPVMY